MKVYSEGNFLTKNLSKLYYNKITSPIKSRWYQRYKRRVLRSIASNGHIRILFFVQAISMWKYESLCNKLKEDHRFDFVIVPFILPWDTIEEQKRTEETIVDYCKEKNFPYLIGYNIDKHEYIPAKDLKADIISYTQPYNSGFHPWLLEHFVKRCAFMYMSYGLPLDTPELNNTLLHNVAWKIFFPNDNQKNIYLSNPVTHGENYQAVGNPFYDQLQNAKATSTLWKIDNPQIKKIIWAPHHTIAANDALPFSTFLEIADDMTALAKKFEGKVQFVFKPHPYLFKRLCSIWGKERTEKYYKEWENMPNTNYTNGKYDSLFLSSDAMIHDCAGFTQDYLFTKKPVMFLSKPGHEKHLAPFALSCFNQHYKGRGINDIQDFINNVVLNGIDPMRASRDEFYNTKLLPPNGQSVAENIYMELKALL